ncbi:asparaginase [Natronosporangium hydrolyticum]|uniref:Asparaginase n=1 Tax=Natronosporangium hydrolyticum TaxID=2811111 RepID=A0A895YK82_9ACTN|nr:asparaginase [Natronosporangium hydrolyticum]QSB14510.1 asparaginase [Natronosporangium hydrolyticum]
MSYRGGVPVAEVTRSDFVESRHHGSVVLLDAAGETVAVTGDVTSAIFPRSSNKPLQAVGMVRSGLRLAEPAELALVCASHWGEPHHLDRVRAMLRHGGLTEEALGCPPSLPLDDDARAAVLAAGGGPTRAQMNCSGKHAGMLLTCLVAGWPIEGYLRPEHPLQQRLQEAVSEGTGEPVAAVGVDGCGAPVCSASLTGLARAFLRLVGAEAGSTQRAIADAMRAHPDLVAGTAATAVDTRLMSAVPGLLAKSGAEGVSAVAVPGVGAVALKVDDGAARARLPVLVAALRQLGVPAEQLAELVDSPVLGGGRPVGAVRSLVCVESR